MKNILLIATGGTIACKTKQDGLKPELDCKELLSYLDDLSDICHVDAIQLFNLDSTNMTYQHWSKIASLIKEKYDLYDGFVITHGTDTMAYAASALSYMIQDSYKPIVFTGSQKSIYMRDNDARSNLTNAFIYASYDQAYGVTIVFDNKVILGTRAKKVRSKSYNAFTSVNYPEIARIIEKKVILYIEKKYQKEDVKFYLNFNHDVMVLKLVPGMDSSLLDYALSHYDLKDKTIVITTQVQYEGSDLNVYQVGKLIKEKYDLLESYDMTIESLVSKIKWILSLTDKKEEIKNLLYTPIYSDILR